MADGKSRWENIKVSDFAILFYWVAAFLTFCVLTNWPLPIASELNLDTHSRRIAFVFLFWFGSVIVVQTLFGYKGLWSILVSFWRKPFSYLVIVTGFLFDSRSMFKRWNSQFPWRLFLVLGYFTVVPLIHVETDAWILEILTYGAWFLLISTIFLCFKWTLNPLPFLETEYTQKTIEKAQKATASNLSKVESTSIELAHSQILKKLEQIKVIVNIVPSVLNLLRGPKLLFSIFISIFAFGVIGTLLLVAGILRAAHLTTSGGVFRGEQFSGSLTDYLYLALNHMIGAEIYGISVVPGNVRYTLSGTQTIFLILTVLLLLAFSMVGHASTDRTFKDYADVVMKGIVEAVKDISEKRVVTIVDERKKDGDVKPDSQKSSPDEDEDSKS